MSLAVLATNLDADNMEDRRHARRLPLFRRPASLVALLLDETTSVMEQFLGTVFTPNSLGVLDASGGALTDFFVPTAIVLFFTATQTKVHSVAVAFDTLLAVAATSNPIRTPVR